MDDNFTSERSFLPGELAASAGVSTDTLRHYERKGVLDRPPRTPNGYRRYPAASLDRIKLIRSALAIGFTLDELARVLRLRDRGEAPCREVHGLAVEKLEALDEQIRLLTKLRTRLRSIVGEWGDRLLETGTSDKVHLLEKLSHNGVRGRTSHAKLSPNKKNKLRR